MAACLLQPMVAFSCERSFTSCEMPSCSTISSWLTESSARQANTIAACSSDSSCNLPPWSDWISDGMTPSSTMFRRRVESVVIVRLRRAYS